MMVMIDDYDKSYVILTQIEVALCPISLLSFGPKQKLVGLFQCCLSSIFQVWESCGVWCYLSSRMLITLSHPLVWMKMMRMEVINSIVPPCLAVDGRWGWQFLTALLIFHSSDPSPPPPAVSGSVSPGAVFLHPVLAEWIGYAAVLMGGGRSVQKIYWTPIPSYFIG